MKSMKDMKIAFSANLFHVSFMLFMYFMVK